MAETEFKYDVFISYSSANKDWVRKDLLTALEKAGLKACIDFRDFKPGKPSIKNIRDGILESKHTLLVMTEPYLKSGWTDFENMLSQTIDPANRDGRIIPLLKEKCDLPLEIKYLTYINFADPDDVDIEWKKLFESLGASHEPKPDNPTRMIGTSPILILCPLISLVAQRNRKCWMTGSRTTQTVYSSSAPWADLAKAPSPGNGLTITSTPLNGPNSSGGLSTKATPVSSISSKKLSNISSSKFHRDSARKWTNCSKPCNHKKSYSSWTASSVYCDYMQV